MYDTSKIQPIVSKNKLVLLKTHRFLRRILRPLGLFVKVDINYHGSYVFHAENMDIRYDHQIGKNYAHAISRYVKQRDVVLDIGCSVGRIQKYLSPYVGEMHGVDISPKAIRMAKKYCRDQKNCKFFKNNGEDLSICEDNKYDFIFSVETFGHMDIEDAFIYIVESFRCLKPGGSSLFQFYSYKQSYDQFAYQSLIGDRTETRRRYADPYQLKIIFESVGYKIKFIQDGGFPIRPDCVWVHAIKPETCSI